jgi:D-lactate dehydrogenase
LKVDFFSAQPFEIASFNSVPHEHQITYHSEKLTADSLAMISNGTDAVCVFVNDKLNKHCIVQLKKKKIKIIALRCAGFNNVDLLACQHHHIKVVNVPHYSPYAVAEHAMALILALNRKIHKAYHRVRDGNFDLNGLQGFDMHGKTIGIIGLGGIGQVFSRICHGFGCHVVAFDPYVEHYPNVNMLTLNELFTKADIISLHCPLNENTRHIINDETIGLMKKHVVLINTGRGALIESKALIKGLKSGKLQAVGLDVYEQESNLFFMDHSMEVICDDILMRLVTFPNVIITSHQGFLTHEALHEIALTTLNNLSLLEKGQNCRYQLV